MPEPGHPVADVAGGADLDQVADAGEVDDVVGVTLRERPGDQPCEGLAVGALDDSVAGRRATGWATLFAERSGDEDLAQGAALAPGNEEAVLHPGYRTAI